MYTVQLLIPIRPGADAYEWITESFDNASLAVAALGGAAVAGIVPPRSVHRVMPILGRVVNPRGVITCEFNHNAGK